MVIFKMLMIWLLVAWSRTVDRFGLKNVSLALTAVALVLFGDTLVPAVWHLLHVMWEVIESIIEHFLEEHFGLKPRQAEFIVAWMGILTMTGAVVKLLYETYLYSVKLFYKTWQQFIILKAEMSENPAKIGLLVGVLSLGATGFLMFS